jgi:putative ABC transport system permease protein
VTPTLLSWAVAGLRTLLRKAAGPAGRLAGDNLARAPARVTLTTLTFAVGLMTIVGMGGFIHFVNGILVNQLAENSIQETAWYIYPFDRSNGLAQLRGFDVDAPRLDPALVADVHRLAQGRAAVTEVYLLVIPETSSPMPGFPTYLMTDLAPLVYAGTLRLSAGNWETALPLLNGPGCALLITPAVAARNGVAIGEVLTLAGRTGPVPCTVAALGAGGFIPVSLIGPGAREDFVPPGQTADGLSVRPLPGVDTAALEVDLHAVAARYPGKAFLMRPEDESEAINGITDQLMVIFNGMVLLGTVAAALGMVNTTVMSVLERRRELGLLRAVGATRRQIGGIVMGEAVLVGLLGALLGAATGMGVGAVFGLSFGGVTFGLTDLPLWWAAGQTVLPALRNGWVGLVAAPLLAALAAYPAVRSVVRGPAISTLRE